MFLRYCLGIVLISLLVCGCETPVDDNDVSSVSVSSSSKDLVSKILVGQDLLIAEKSANPEKFRVITGELKENWEKISPTALKTSEVGLKQRLAVYEKHFANLSEVYEKNRSKYSLQKTSSCSYNYYQCGTCGFIYCTYFAGCFEDQPDDYSCPLCGVGKDSFESIADQGWSFGGMIKVECSICGYVYDPAQGDPDSDIAPGTSFIDIPSDWVCPLCGYPKYVFRPID